MRYKTLSILIITLFLSGCAGIVGQNDLTYLRQGMSPNQVRLAMNNQPKKIFVVSVFGKRYQVQKYFLQNGDESSEYYLAFDQQHLIFWGYLNEFARSYDKRINEIGRQIIAYKLGELNKRLSS